MSDGSGRNVVTQLLGVLSSKFYRKRLPTRPKTMEEAKLIAWRFESAVLENCCVSLIGIQSHRIEMFGDGTQED